MYFAHAVLFLILAGQGACCAVLPSRPPGCGLFVNYPPQAAGQAGLGAPWLIGAGAAVVICLVFWGWRLICNGALKTENSLWVKWGSSDACRLAAALDLLNETALSWRGRKTVVRLSQWLAKKDRPPASKAENL